MGVNELVTLPLLIPLTAAAASLVAWGRHRVQLAVAVGGSGALLVAAVALLLAVERNGPLVVYVGSWPAPFGIVLVADIFSAIMVLLAAIVGFVIVLYSITGVDRRLEAFGYYPLVLILLLGVCGAFLTGDLFNLYVWFEVMLIASFVLLSLGGDRPRIEGGLKYVALNLVSSILFLSGVGIVYGVAGTLNMADLALRFDRLADPAVLTTVAMLFLVAFGIKAAIFPLFFGRPASYHTPPAAVSALFAGLLTKVGVYALIRVFTLLFDDDPGYTHTIILILAGLTMVAGVLGAVAEREFRRILSFHIVSQIGYMIMGLGLFTTFALAATVFYITHHILVKSALFLVSGAAARFGDGTYKLERLGGLAGRSLLLAFLFAVPAMSLAGLPPFSGFFAKLALIQAGFEIGQYLIVGVAIAVSFLTLMSMMKIWSEAFWKPAPTGLDTSGDPADRGHHRGLLAPIAILAVLTIAIGFGAEPVFELSTRAAEQLMDPTVYIEAVLGADAMPAAGVGPVPSPAGGLP
jgi:multicomponent Na+:H+ antiporter subunit D